jgi:hypothetical protein
MEVFTTCPECGAAWQAEESCETYFHQMLYWEAEFPSLGEVHHLMVLCYYLQHPSLYSPEGLKEARRLLVEFVEHGASPAKVRQRNRAQIDSSKRIWKITAAPTAHGSYAAPVHWMMTAVDVIAGGSEKYCANVQAWAKSIDETLRALS